MDGLLGRRRSAVLAGANANAHMRYALAFHDGLDVRKVQIDEAGHSNQIGNALDALAQHIVCHAERVQNAGTFAHDKQQPVVGDDDQRIYIFLDGRNALLGVAGALFALKGERPGNNTHRENPHLAGDLRDDGGRTCASTAAHARGNEYHIGALDGRCDIVFAFLRSPGAHLRVCAGAQAARHLFPDLDTGRCFG